MSADLIIENGEVRTARETYEGDIVVRNGTIIDVANTAGAVDADRRIDASEKVVLPGLINTHVHFREPGLTDREDFTTGSKCAAAGGYTMFMDMPNCDPNTDTLEAYREKQALAEEKAVIDHNSWAGATDPDDVREIYENTGNLGFKIFMHRHPRVSYPYDPDLAVYETDRLFSIFREIASMDQDIPVHLHPSDVNLGDELYDRLVDMDATDYGAIREGKDGVNMSLGAYEAAFLARLNGLQKLCIIHVGFNEAYPDPHIECENRITILDVVRDLREQGWNVYTEGEACTLLQNRREVTWDQRWYTTDREKLWTAAEDGTLDMLLIEHAPAPAAAAEKDDAWDATTGLIGTQEFLPLMLTRINDGRLSLNKLAELCSENPAKYLGIFPEKGDIRVGTDADFTIVDMDETGVINGATNFSKCDWSSFDGYEVKGMPTQTIVRGETVYEDGEILVGPGFGEYVSEDDYR